MDNMLLYDYGKVEIEEVSEETRKNIQRINNDRKELEEKFKKALEQADALERKAKALLKKYGINKYERKQDDRRKQDDGQKLEKLL